MIQRIQSLYLLLASLSAIFTLGTPLARFPQGDGYHVMTAFGFDAVGTAPLTTTALPYGLLACCILLVALPLVALFGYKNRQRQVKLCNWIVAVIVLYGVSFVAYGISFASDIETSLKPAICAFLPLLELVLVMLARRGVKHDEALVRAADRIR